MAGVRQNPAPALTPNSRSLPERDHNGAPGKARAPPNRLISAGRTVSTDLPLRSVTLIESTSFTVRTYPTFMPSGDQLAALSVYLPTLAERGVSAAGADPSRSDTTNHERLRPPFASQIALPSVDTADSPAVARTLSMTRMPKSRTTRRRVNADPDAATRLCRQR